VNVTEPLLARLYDARVAVIHEQVDNSRWQMLRSLPALQSLGVDAFTYPTSWRQLSLGAQYDFPGYTYRHIDEAGDVDPTDAPPFGIVTNQHYEWETPYSVRSLVERYTRGDSQLVVVTDNRRFTPEGGQRPLYQEQFATDIGSYDRVYGAFEDRYERFGFGHPLRDTRNLFLQDNANLYELVEGEPVTTARALFNRLSDAPYLPLYDVFGEIFGRTDDFGSVPLDSDETIDALGRWLRRRVEFDRQTGRAVAAELNDAVVESRKAFDPSYAPRSPEVAEAQRAGRELDREESPIHDRYVTWLTGERV
jgi:hypothetical protein